jgi:hypothetical protein
MSFEKLEKKEKILIQEFKNKLKEALRISAINYAKYPSIICLIQRINMLPMQENINLIDFIIRKFKYIQTLLIKFRKEQITLFENLGFNLNNVKFNTDINYDRCRDLPNKINQIELYGYFTFIHQKTYLHNYINFNISIGYNLHMLSEYSNDDENFFITHVNVIKNTLKPTF